ncbi:MAG: acetamidase/formamidase family protein [Acetobacteraceae bacterium]|nr:acetamidase/formamidase family protein [Acetobacteraceae bacterium]
MTAHRVSASPQTVHWGTFSAAIDPVLTIRSGDTVTLECVSGPADCMPPPGSGLVVPHALSAIHRAVPQRGPHILTGPVAVAGAEPGDMLEVRIDKIEFGADWGFCGHRPLAGTLPEDFPDRFLSHIPIDRAANTCTLPWGMVLPLQPFFGVMGVAPKPSYGVLSTKEPREHGGNLDNKELGAGSTLFLPVFVDGANFSAGDGHGVQGDGEVCINALEICLTGTFTLTLHKGDGLDRPALRYPRGETTTHYISMGMHEDLDVAMKTALREMIAFICSRTNLSRDEAYQLCSLAVDFHVTQTVNGEKGVHGMLQRTLLS